MNSELKAMSNLAIRPPAEAWFVVEDNGFIGLIGPLWQRDSHGKLELALATDEKHRNRSGVVQGGVICTLADRALGTASRLASNAAVATVKLDMTLIERASIGDFLIAKPTLIKMTTSLSFGRVDILSNGRITATAEGIFKILRPN